MTTTVTAAFSGPYTPNGVTTSFAVTFQSLSVAEIAVELDGVKVNSGFTFNRDADGTGNVVFAAPPIGTSLIIRSEPNYQQNDSFTRFGPYFPDFLNPIIDRFARRLIALRSDVARGVYVPFGEQGVRLPSAASRVGAFLSFDALGRAIMSSGTGADGALRIDLAQPTGGTRIGFKQSGTGTVLEDMKSVLERFRFATQHGLSPTASAAVNKKAVQDAINATPTGGRLVVGDHSETFILDVTGGFSGAISITRPMTIEIRGTLVCNAFAVQFNPYYMFRVSAPDVIFTGSGTIKGTGQFDDSNSGSTTSHPGLIYVEADRFVFDSGLTIRDIPKVGITLAACFDATISGKFYGGPAVYNEGIGELPITVDNPQGRNPHTGHFAIIATGGGRHVYDGARAERGPNGERIVNFIFASGAAGVSNNNVVRNCFADVHEKLFYGDGSFHFVHNNTGFGFQTDWIRLNGPGHRAHDNKCVGAKGLISAYDGVGIEIINNIGTGLRQAGIFVGRLNPLYTGGFAGLKVSGNTLIGDPTSIILASGLSILTAGSNTIGITVQNNRVENFGQNAGDALIRVAAQAPSALLDVKISSNKLGSTGKVGIALDQVADAVVENNSGNAITQFFLSQTNSARIQWINNVGINLGAIGINGIESTSEGRGNRYTAALLNFTVTVAAGANHTHPHGAIAPNAIIQVTGLTPGARDKPVTAERDVSNNLLLTPATAFAGGEIYQVSIIQ